MTNTKLSYAQRKMIERLYKDGQMRAGNTQPTLCSLARRDLVDRSDGLWCTWVLAPAGEVLGAKFKQEHDDMVQRVNRAMR